MAGKMSRRHFNRTMALGGIALAAGCSVRSKLDVLIKNARIVDGTGIKYYKGDVGIVGDRIEAMGDLGNATAGMVIDAEGMVLSPGFVDIHTHTDMELLADPSADSKIMQGVTTEVAGNCGSSPFPLLEDDRHELYGEYKEKYGIDFNWTDLDGFLTEIEKRGTALNYATLTGHGALRAYGVGRNDVEANAVQMERMKLALQLSLDQGSFGLSTGLEYAPGSYASTGELIELNHVVARAGKLYATHMRNEDDRVEEALEEAIEIARKTGVSLEVSHLKACNRKNWQKVPRLLEMLEKADDERIDIMADRYPYTAYGTGLSAFIPLWARQGEKEDILARLKSDEQFARIREHTEARGENIGGWSRVVISYCGETANKRFEGMSIREYAREKRLDDVEAVRRLLIEDDYQVGIVGFAMDEDNLKKVLSHPLVMPGSDGNAVNPNGVTGAGKPHPRFYGSFPRYFGKYHREEGLFDLETAIHKMSAMPAKKLGLRNRGEVHKGWFADLLIFDPEKFIDTAEFTDPHQLALGLKYMFVNGRLTVQDGLELPALHGRVLRS